MNLIGYPNCVNATYGLMTTDCLVRAYQHFGVKAVQEWVTFDQAFSIMGKYTGQINPLGMYHFMGMRGTSMDNLWVANSAPGYQGVNDWLTRSQFSALSPVQVVYLEERL